MDAQEAPRVEAVFEMAERFAQEMGFGSDVQGNIVAAGFDPINIFSLEKVHAPGRFDDEAVREFRWSFDAFEQREQTAVYVAQPATFVTVELLARMRKRLAKAFVTEGLQKVIQRVDGERPDGVFIESRDENDRGQTRGVERGQRPKAVELRHLNVEKDQIRLDPFDGRDGFAPVAAFAENFDVGFGGEKAAHAAARDGFVIHDYRLDLHPLRQTCDKEWSYARSSPDRARLAFRTDAPRRKDAAAAPAYSTIRPLL